MNNGALFFLVLFISVVGVPLLLLWRPAVHWDHIAIGFTILLVLTALWQWWIGELNMENKADE